MPGRLHGSVALALVALLLAAGCRVRDGRGVEEPDAGGAPVVTAAPPRSAPTAAPSPTTSSTPAPKALPRLDHEPRVGVLLMEGRRLEVTLLAPARLAAGGRTVDLPAGRLVVESAAGGWRLASTGAIASGIGVLQPGAKPGFAATLVPPFGKPLAVKLAGALEIHPAGNGVQLVERLPMEAYLAGVLPVEMNPTWPTAALAAQAIAARSYAGARWVARADRPWQLHWHFSVDMAYHGWRAPSPNVASALAATRGQVLFAGGHPLLALFHASSGGRTESSRNAFPGVRAPDGAPLPAGAMPVVDDAASPAGAQGLGLAATHVRWKADVPLAEITAGLTAWTAEKPRERPAFGTVTNVRPASRFPDSGRVATVVITHRLGKKTVETTIPATEFRMAAGPGTVRSTAWTRCVVASRNGGTLVLEGTGFGHGVGLSQVGAWQLAKQGQSPAAIVDRYYPGTELRTAY